LAVGTAKRKRQRSKERGAQFHGLVQQRIGMTLRAITPSPQPDIVGALRSFQSFGGINDLIFVLLPRAKPTPSSLNQRTYQSPMDNPNAQKE
jgi:hypothetical protein